MSRKAKYLIVIILVLGVAGYAIYKLVGSINPNPKYEIGQALDSLNGVKVYYNGGIGHVSERHTTPDGYNIGLNYQCVEFVKRYYYEFYQHKMPDSYGNAKDFFDASVADGKLNKKRNLLQYTNPGKFKPRTGDLVIMDGHSGNPYGHVAIISNVTEGEIEIIQQNPGPFADSRVRFPLDSSTGRFYIEKERLLGWLRKAD